LAAALLALVPCYALGMLYYGGAPQTIAVGYQPVQPIPYSHALHAGDLRIDCRYCHTPGETAGHMGMPSTAVCMNCHATIAVDSEKLLPLKESAVTGRPIRWVRVHDLPDYVYFDHSAHVFHGVGCVSCHGRVDTMDRVYQAEKLSMGWCLDCHRNPERHLRPQQFVTDMTWTPNEDQVVQGKRLAEQNNIKPSTDCSTCHR
jgi:hypothetical protein